ncbi:MAG: AAA family ATPase [Promethearchaeota archaeon]
MGIGDDKMKENNLDNILNGVLERSKLYHVFGTSGTGKTTLAMQVAASVAKKNRIVAWIDTMNNFSTSRILKIIGNQSSRSKVKVLTARHLDVLEHGIRIIMSKIGIWRLGLVVVDTVFGCFNLITSDQETFNREWRAAAGMIDLLQLLSTTGKFPIILTNTMGYKPQIGKEKPTAEILINKHDPINIFLKKTTNLDGKFHLSAIIGDIEVRYEITGSGLKILT